MGMHACVHACRRRTRVREGDRVLTINRASDKAVIVSETALAEASVSQLAEIVVQIADGAFFLLACGGGLDSRNLFTEALIAEVKSARANDRTRDNSLTVESAPMLKSGMICATADRALAVSWHAARQNQKQTLACQGNPRCMHYRGPSFCSKISRSLDIGR